jgi:hypothetical protein
VAVGHIGNCREILCLSVYVSSIIYASLNFCGFLEVFASFFNCPVHSVLLLSDDDPELQNFSGTARSQLQET